MEQLLIQATIMRAKSLARRINDERDKYSGQETKCLGSNAGIENKNEHPRDEANRFLVPHGVNSKTSLTSPSLLAAVMLRGNSGAIYTDAARNMVHNTAPSRLTGKWYFQRVTYMFT